MDNIPLIQIKQILIASLQGDINDNMALSLQQRILEKIYASGSQGVLIDISMLDMVDSYLGRIISETIKMVELLGAKAVLTGMKPYIAITMMELGLNINGIEIASNSDVGFQILEEHIKSNNFEVVQPDDLYEQEVE